MSGITQTISSFSSLMCFLTLRLYSVVTSVFLHSVSARSSSVNLNFPRARLRPWIRKSTSSKASLWHAAFPRPATSSGKITHTRAHPKTHTHTHRRACTHTKAVLFDSWSCCHGQQVQMVVNTKYYCCSFVFDWQVLGWKTENRSGRAEHPVCARSSSVSDPSWTR